MEEVAVPTPLLRNSARWPWIVAGLVLLGPGLFTLRIVLAVGFAWLHYRSTPDFATFVGAHPVSEELAASHWDSSAPLLSSEGRYSVGEVDPFELPEDDPEHEPRALTFRVSVWHGEERLLELEQVAAAALVRGSSERDGFGLQTTRCETAPGWRVRARTWISEDDTLSGPNSARAGAVLFEVLLLAGDGGDRLEVVRGRGDRGQLSDSSEGLSPPLRSLLGFVHPTGSPPEGGLIYRFQQAAYLSWERSASGSSSVQLSDFEHAVNTAQYSYRIEAETSDGGWKRGVTKKIEYTWNGEIW